jgi:hypothetical protein
MKTTSIIAMALLGMFTTFTASAQNNVGIGTASPDASAALEIESTTQGFLPPRLSSTQRDAIAAPVAVGLIVWCTNCGTNGEVQVYNGSAWTNMVGAAAALSLQERLDGGETPFSIYNTLVTGGSTSSSAALDSLYGKTYKGGLIAYLNTTTGTGLIAAATDQSTGIQWTMSAHQSTTVPNGATSTTDGLANSNAIVAQAGAGSTYAAGLCRAYSAPGDGGLNDWYLPSKDELNYLWENLADSDGDNSNTGPTDPNNLGGFAANYYWSSTENVNIFARGQNFTSGNQGNGNKDFTDYVRAVRAF